MKILLNINLVLFIYLQYGRLVCAECNVCSAMTNMACVSETQFQTCINQLPAGPINTCPNNYVCSTLNTIICIPNTGNNNADCGYCNQCDPTLTFACTGARTFALCLGDVVPSEITGSCAPYHVCNINYRQICGNATMGIQATCSFVEDTSTVSPTISTSSSTTTTTISPVFNPAAYCQAIARYGRFPIGTNIDTSCKQYVYCFLYGGVWSGAIYTCPGNTYFDSTSALCTNAVPARCAGTVRRLLVRNIDFESSLATDISLN